MNFSILLYALLPIVSTFLGGYVVLKWKRDLHPWLSLSGGILLGVAFLDLLPEAFEHSAKNGIGSVTVGAVALGAILFYHLLDELLGSHHHEHGANEPDEHCENEHHKHIRAWTRVAGLILHSFLDGLAIGGGFAASAELGFIVTAAVVLHDFSDGMSTVTILKHSFGQKHRGALVGLIFDAFAPFLGVLAGYAIAVSESTIALLLAFFAGSFISLALSELLPQAHAGKIRRSGLALTIIGIGIAVLVRTLGGA